MTNTFISATTYLQNQTWYHEEIRKFSGHGAGVVSLKATIKRNAYDDQSCVQIAKWSDSNGWNVIATYPITDYPARQLSYVRTDLTSDDIYALEETTDYLFGIAKRFSGVSEGVSV